MKKLILPLITLAVCVAVMWQWTSGFRAFTVFSHTLYEAGNTPRPLPNIALIDQNNAVFHINSSSKYKLVNFVYLDCPYACHRVINELDGVYKHIAPGILSKKLHFYTISFDLKHDSTARLRNYRANIDSNIPDWTFGRPYKSTQRAFDAYLDKIGIWKYRIPGTMRINHALYVFLVSPNNRIIRVFDPAQLNEEQIAQKVQLCIENGNRPAYTSLF